MTSPDLLDQRWKDGLDSLAAYPRFAPETRERVLARAAQRRRRRRQATEGAVAAVVVGAALTAVGVARGADGTTPSPHPVVPATAPAPVAFVQFSVPAGELALVPKQVRVPAGVIEVRVRDDGDGSHVYAIEGIGGFVLEVNAAGDVASGRVELGPGRYTLACTVPGHAAAGETATIVVTPRG
jgi:uncharacterized cupredoxin-like copper-binding protein